MPDPAEPPAENLEVNVAESASGALFEPYDSPAGGWGSLQATAHALREQSIVVKGSKALLAMNQPDGFDCPGCAWPDPKHASSFEFCENGVKAVAAEPTKRRVTREFFAEHSVSELATHSDYELEEQGRLTEPLRYERVERPLRARVAGTTHSPPIARCLNAPREPGRSRVLHVRPCQQRSGVPVSDVRAMFGTNNFPDCSNMCHEATSVGLPREHRHRQRHGHARGLRCTPIRSSSSARIPAPTVRACWLNCANARAAARPSSRSIRLRERALERFTAPQHPVDMLT